MEGEQLVNLVILGVHDINDQQYSAALHRSITFADRKGGHYSLEGTLFTSE